MEAMHKVIKSASMLFLIILCFAVFGLELIFDMRKNLFWYRIVIGFDIALICAYFYLVMSQVYIYRHGFFELLKKEKADCAYFVLVCFVLPMPRIAAALIIIRLALNYFMKWLSTPLGIRVVGVLNLKPSQTLALSFIANISVGTILLTMPAATIDGHGASFINALFTMTSANCVAGLSVLDIGNYFTRFGQAIILYGMQAGGLGIMVMAAAFAVFMGGVISSRRQAGMSEALDVSTPEGFKSLIKSVATITITAEFIGALALFIFCRDEVPGFENRLWWSIFHSISAFCNAGLGLFPDSFMAFVNNPAACLIIILLITSGGVGFFVISDLTNSDVWAIKKPKAVWDRLQIQTRVVLVAYVILDIFGMLLFLFFEYDGALHGLAVSSKIMASLFHTVSLRSAGFNIVPTMLFSTPTILIGVAYMFIGSAPGSTGGGIKVTTAAISIVALRAMIRGRSDVEIMGRRIPPAIVNRSLAILMVSMMVITVFLTLLLATQDLKFENLLFETVSAFGTVGLSLDTTSLLNNWGKVLIICVMYIGRIGPLTLALVIGGKKMAPGYQLPQGSMAVG
jgi:trk system potassium uptake protein TrkH